MTSRNPDQPPNPYSDSRYDIEKMYGPRNDPSDYGTSGVPLGDAVHVEPVEASDESTPEQLDLFSQEDYEDSPEPTASPADDYPRYPNGKIVVGSAARRPTKDRSPSPSTGQSTPPKTARERGYEDMAQVEARRQTRKRWGR